MCVCVMASLNKNLQIQKKHVNHHFFYATCKKDNDKVHSHNVLGYLGTEDHLTLKNKIFFLLEQKREKKKFLVIENKLSIKYIYVVITTPD